MDFKEIGARVRALRRKQGLSQERLAELAGVAQGTLSRIENGHVDMRLVTLGFVAKALDIPVIELIGADAERSLRRSREDRPPDGARAAVA